MTGFDEIKIPWDGWTIVREIGQGSFGTVYEIERRLLSTTEKAAMKVISIPKDESEFELFLFASGYDEASAEDSINKELQRVEREYAVMSRMRGISNIVSCEDFAYRKKDNGKGYVIYIRMELMRSLQSVIKEKRKARQTFSEDEVIKLGKDICNALICCEKEGIIHRDIKPGNILISRLGVYNLGDFGTARSIDHTTHATYTGTISYMAPEVFKRQKYGKTVDIYSIGLVLYWLMNGYKMPFFPLRGVPSADEATDAENKRMNGTPLPPPCKASEEFSSVILKACSYRSEDRYQSASEMLADLERLEKTDEELIKEIQGHIEKRYKIVNRMIEIYNEMKEDLIEKGIEDSLDLFAYYSIFDKNGPLAYLEKELNQEDEIIRQLKEKAKRT